MISTGLKKLDQFLGGGIKEGLITDVYGSNATGKTQLALQISLNVLKNGGQVLFQDTTSEFRPERLVEMMRKQEISSALLEKIKVGLITNTTQQIQYLSKIPIENFSLIVIDNVTDLFSFEYSKKEHVLEKYIFFMKYMHNLSNIAINTKIPIIVTNTVGKINDLEQTAREALRTAKTLKENGINLNFAPVLDLLLSKDNIIIKKQRSFSSNPDKLTNHAKIVIDTHMDNNIIAVAKHFPGQGSSIGDTHEGWVDVSESWSEKELFDWVDPNIRNNTKRDFKWFKTCF